MAVTDEQYQGLLTRARRLEQTVNDILVAIQHFMTQGDVNQLLTLLQTKLEQLQAQIIDLSIQGASTDDITLRIGLEKLFNIAYQTQYSEMGYTGDNLTSITIWETAAKNTKLYTRTLSYTGDNLTTVITVDELENKSLTTTLTYDVDDNLETVTKVVA